MAMKARPYLAAHDVYGKPGHGPQANEDQKEKGLVA
jgi:hypothetical protein